MYACNILHSMQPMLGLDYHECIIPPAPPTPLPYAHVSFLGHGLLPEKSKISGMGSYAAKGMVKTSYFLPVLQGTCCGYMDLHIGNMANTMYPLILAFSSSKSLFVSGTVSINGANVACAAGVVLNLNLNCSFPCSLPLGFVTAFNTVLAGMSVGDVIAGIVSGLLQMGLEYGIGKFIGFAGGLPITRNPASSNLNNYASRAFERTVSSSFINDGLRSGLRTYIPQLGDPALGIILDQTPAEDFINDSTSSWLGSDPNDVF